MYALCASLILLVLAAPAFPHQDESTWFRQLIDAAPRLPLQRTELALTPPLVASSPSHDRQISSVAVDPQGHVYMLQRGVTKPVVVADRNGTVLRSWGEGLFKIPHSVRIDPAGNVWAIDAQSSMVYKFTPDGTKLLEISVGGQPAIPPPVRVPRAEGSPVLAGQFVGTTDIAFAANGDLYVSDGYGNARVIHFDKNGRKIREWGTPGSGPGQFQLLHGIAIGADGNVYVADRENGRVQWFTPDGKYLGEWKSGGRVFSLAFSPTNDLYLAVRSKDAPLGSEGWLVKVDPKTGKLLGAVASSVHSVAVAADGTLFSGTTAGRVLVFRPAR